VKYVFVHACGTIPYLASRFAIVDQMDVIPCWPGSAAVSRSPATGSRS
jgi:hypothetical protein